jgi:hypothetical protein
MRCQQRPDFLEPFGATQMAFWRKSIELPDAFYQAAGECLLYTMESLNAGQRLQSSPMTFDQAYKILGLAKRCLVKLRALISQYPIKSISSLGMRDQGCEATIQACEEKMKAILALPDVDRSLPICQYSADINGLDVAHFEQSVINMFNSMGAEYHMVTKQMAKGANINSDKFLKLAAQTARETPRGLSLARLGDQC